MLYRKWKIKKSSRTGVRSLQNRLGIPKLAARVLCSKGITEPEKAKKVFLEDTPLSDPYLMLDMDKAVERITRAIENEEKIQEAMAALQVLGYNKKEIEKAFDKLAKEEMTTEELIRKGLTILGK